MSEAPTTTREEHHELVAKEFLFEHGSSYEDPLRASEAAEEYAQQECDRLFGKEQAEVTPRRAAPIQRQQRQTRERITVTYQGKEMDLNAAIEAMQSSR